MGLYVTSLCLQGCGAGCLSPAGPPTPRYQEADTACPEDPAGHAHRAAASGDQPEEQHGGAPRTACSPP